MPLRGVGSEHVRAPAAAGAQIASPAVGEAGATLPSARRTAYDETPVVASVAAGQPIVTEPSASAEAVAPPGKDGAVASTVNA